MAEFVNLRMVRKQAKRKQADRLAHTNRLAHGQPKNMRDLEDARQTKASHELDGHRIEPGDR